MLQLNRVSHDYGGIVALRDLSLTLEEGEILGLVGPSGCGKTTLLRVVAGLEPAYRGLVSLRGADMRSVPVHQREFGFMFQDYALFPHMTVSQNIAYGLKRRGKKRTEIGQAVAAMLKRLGLNGLGGRDVATLSGGQKQRVALARSLAPMPRLLMLDEPLGSLDARLRDDLALELRQLIKSLGLSAIYVTHDLREAYALSDRIGVMSDGSVQQCAPPRELYNHPETVFVARFLGFKNIFAQAESAFIQPLLPSGSDADFYLIHPRGIRLAGAGRGCWRAEARLESAVFRGDRADISVRLPEGPSLHFSVDDVPAAIGERLSIEIAAAAVKPLQRHPVSLRL